MEGHGDGWCDYSIIVVSSRSTTWWFVWRQKWPNEWIATKMSRDAVGDIKSESKRLASERSAGGDAGVAGASEWCYEPLHPPIGEARPPKGG